MFFIFPRELGDANELFDLRFFGIIFSLLLLWNEFVVLAGLNFYADFSGLFTF